MDIEEEGNVEKLCKLIKSCVFILSKNVLISVMKSFESIIGMCLTRQ